MAELIVAFIALAILGAMTLAGVWMTIGAFRLFGRMWFSIGVSSGQKCPSCGERSASVETRCPGCGYVFAESRSKNFQRELSITVRTIKRLRELGSLEQELIEPVVKAAIEQQEQIARRSAGFGTASAFPPIEKVRVPSPDQRETPEVSPTEGRPPAVSGARSPSERSSTAPDAPPAPSEPAIRAPARKSFAELLQTFMEERNLRWGEFLSGALIVGSAIGLTVSLWAALGEKIHFLPALILMGVTLLLQFAGLFVHSRWKLASTSRGLLVIGLLLVPLCVFSLIALSRNSLDDPLYRGSAVAGLLAFAVTGYASSRAILPSWPVPTVLGVVGLAAFQLVLRHALSPDSPAPTQFALASLPTLLYVGCCGAVFMSARRLTEPLAEADRSLIYLGIVTFSQAVVAVLAFAKLGLDKPVVELLAPLVSVLSVPALLFGGWLHRGATTEQTRLRMQGTTLALLGGFFSACGLLAAWPDPATLIAVAVLNGLLYLVVVGAADLAAMYVAAAASFAFAGLVGFHYGQAYGAGREIADGQTLAALLLTGRSSPVLLGFAAAFGAVAALFRRAGREESERMHLLGAASVSAVALAISLYSGFRSGHDGWLASVVLPAAAATLLAICRRLPSTPLAWGASALLLTSFVHALLFNEPVAAWLERAELAPRAPLLWTLLLHAAFAATIGLWFKRKDRSVEEPGNDAATARFALPLQQSGLIGAVLAFPSLFLPNKGFGEASLLFIVAAAGWLAHAAATHRPAFLNMFQFAVVCATTTFVTSKCQEAEWWRGAISVWDARLLHLQAIALTALSLAYVAAARVKSSAPLIVAARSRWSLAASVVAVLVAGQFCLAWIGAYVSVFGPLDPTAVASADQPAAWTTALLVCIAALGPPLALPRRSLLWAGLLYFGFLTLWIAAAPGIGRSLVEATTMTESPTLAVARWTLWGLLVALLAFRFRFSRSAPNLWAFVATLSLLPLLATWHFGLWPLEIASISPADLNWLLAATAGVLSAAIATKAFSGESDRFGRLGAWLYAIGLAAIPTLHFAWNGLWLPTADSPAWAAFSAGGPAMLLGLYAAAVSLRERSLRFALAGAGLCGAAVCLGVLATHRLGRVPYTVDDVARLLTASALTLIAYAYAWRMLSTVFQYFGNGDRVDRDVLAYLARTATALLGVAALGSLPVIWLRQPMGDFTEQWALHAGSPTAWTALLLIGALPAIGWFLSQSTGERTDESAAALIALAPPLAACMFAATSLTPFRVLIISWPFASVVYLFASAPLTQRIVWGRESRGSGRLAAGAVSGVLLATLAQSVFGAADPALRLWCASGTFLAALPLGALALRQRRQEWALVSGLAVNWSATLAAVHYAGPMPFIEWTIVLLQLNVAVLALSAVFWKSFAETAENDKRIERLPVRWFRWQAASAVIAQAGLLAIASLQIAISSDALPSSLHRVGSFTGLLCLLAVLLGVAIYRRSLFPKQSTANAVSASLYAAVLFAGAAAIAASAPDDWRAFHTLAGGLSVYSLGVAAFLAFGRRWASLERLGWEVPDARLLTAWSLSAAAPAAVAAVLNGWRDPAGPIPSAVFLAFVGAASFLLALARREERFAGAFIGASCASVGLVAADPGRSVWESQFVYGLFDAALWVIAGGALAGLLWSSWDIKALRDRGEPIDPTKPQPELAATAKGLTLETLAALFVAGAVLFSTRSGYEAPILDTLSGRLAMLGVAALAIASFWDPRSRDPFGWFYLLGLAILTQQADRLRQLTERPLLTLTAALSVQALASGLLWRLAGFARSIAGRLRLPERPEAGGSVAKWLPVANACLAAALAPAVLYFCAESANWQPRLWAVAAGASLSAGMVMSVHGQRRLGLQWAALTSIVAVGIGFGWSLLPPDAAYVWLHRCIRLMSATASLAFVYSALSWLLAPTRIWQRAIQIAAVTTSSGAVVSLTTVLAMEARYFNAVPGIPGAPIAGWQIAAVAVILSGLAAAWVSFALAPRDPLQFSEHSRSVYVYVAEIVLAMLFAHMFFTMPELFQGMLRPYWPLIVLAIAFIGTGLGELAERMRLRVLAAPLSRTGAFLPLLPVLGFWIVAAEHTRYSAVLFVAGALYLALCVVRQSFAYGALAALAGNAGLLVLLHEQGFAIASHPQVWFVPPALSVLIAAQINRDRLAESQLATIRYVAVMMIYVSSTSDMFLNGIGTNVWLPVTLAVLSVLGVLSGIVLQVRAFLYLGSAFLLLSQFSLVWHAARNVGHLWPVWSFLFFFGLAVLLLFGFFERKRDQILLVVGGLRQWER